MNADAVEKLGAADFEDTGFSPHHREIIRAFYLTTVATQDVLAQLAQFEKIARAKSDDHAARSEFFRGKAEGFRRSIDVVRVLLRPRDE